MGRSLKGRLERAIPKTGRRPILITSQRLVDASFARLDAVDLADATLDARAGKGARHALALRYRDALLVALATFFPLRRTNLAQLEIGTTIRRDRNGWLIELPASLVKNNQSLDAGLRTWMAERAERYIALYRPLICGSDQRKGFWASAKGCPATGDALYNAFCKEVKASPGLRFTLHDTRRIGITTVAVHDPANAAVAKDLLADRSDRVIARHYNLAASVEASQKMAGLVSKFRGGEIGYEVTPEKSKQ